MFRLLLCVSLLALSGCEVADLLSAPSPAGPPEAPSSASSSAMLEAVNAARAQGRVCGDERMEAAAPLAWDGSLQQAARNHSRDMQENERFSHVGSDGSRVGDRARRAGYEWRRVGENLARMNASPGGVVQALLRSPSHCAAIMDPLFTELGAAETGGYWTQVFGHPR